jgi:hypothetical protein
VSIPTKAVWPYMQQWHVDLEHEVVRNTVARLSYVGSKGTHLTRQGDFNQLAPLPLSQNPYQIGEAGNFNPNDPASDCNTLQTPRGAPIPTAGLNNLAVACGANADRLRTYQGYGSINRLQDSASSTYHALQLGVRRSVGGLELNFAYTYSHSIDDSSSRGDGNLVNYFNPHGNRASSNFDERHNLDFGYVWDIPLFKTPGLTHKLLGGWQYSGIMTFNTGSPFTVTFPGDNAGVGNGITSTASYADVIGDPNAGGHTTIPGGGIQIFNPGAFTAPRGLTFGDSGRNFLRNPNRTNFDMSLFKHFAIKENVAVEFRAEAYNVFNHTQLGYINGDGGSGASNSATLNSGTSSTDSSNFLQILAAHNPRILQLGAKFIF